MYCRNRCNPSGIVATVDAGSSCTHQLEQFVGVLWGADVPIIVEVGIDGPILGEGGATVSSPGFQLGASIIMGRTASQTMETQVNEIRRDGEVHWHAHGTHRDKPRFALLQEGNDFLVVPGWMA